MTISRIKLGCLALTAMFCLISLPSARAADEPVKAVAKIKSSKNATTQPVNKDITGAVTFTFTPGDGKVTFVADLDGFAPNSVHGFHIHEKPDLTAADLSSAGGHFNPGHQEHGGPDSAHHHLGDLGNLTADDKGHAHLEGELKDAALGNDADSILNRSVIVHAKPDDLKSQPAGDSGARIAGGVIELGK